MPEFKLLIVVLFQRGGKSERDDKKPYETKKCGYCFSRWSDKRLREKGRVGKVWSLLFMARDVGATPPWLKRNEEGCFVVSSCFKKEQPVVSFGLILS